MFEAMLNSISLVGADMPAYRALFDRLIETMHSSDQATLRQRYDDALADAARAHAAAQEN